jgi:uncharacterized membrane protein
MKTQVLSSITLILFLLFSFISCEKNTDDLKADQDDQSAQLAIKSLVEEAGNRYLAGEVALSENTEAVNTRGEGLIDEYTADEKGLNDTRPQNSFVSCIRSVEPDSDQRMKLSRALSAYSDRNQRIIGTHRESMQNLTRRVMTARNQLLLSFEAGEINREQYRKEVQALTERYQESVKRIRTSNLEAFSRSYTLMLEHLESILNQRQWNSFTSCMSS